MRKLSLSALRRLSAERLSQRVFYVLLGLSAVVFALFYLVGFDMPSDFDPDFSEPLFTDLLLLLMLLLLVCGVAAAAWSLWHAWHVRSVGDAVTNGIPVARIHAVVWLSAAVLLLLSFLFSSSSPMTVNGEAYTSWLGLKLTGMFIVSSAVLLVAAAGAVVFGSTRYIRKERKGK